VHLFVVRAKSLMCQNGLFARSVVLFPWACADFVSFQYAI